MTPASDVAAGRVVLHGTDVVLRTVEDGDVPALVDLAATPKVARWWLPVEGDTLPRARPDGHAFTVLLDGARAGIIEYAEAVDARHRRADVDLFLDPRLHGRGLGGDAVRTLARHLFDTQGHHRIAAEPAVANASAIRCLEKVGFRRCGVLRRHERNWQTGGYRDAVLLDLLAEDLTSPP